MRPSGFRILNLPAGLPLTSFITPDGKLHFGAGYLPAEHKGSKGSFEKPPMSLSHASSTNQGPTRGHFNWRLQSDREKNHSEFTSLAGRQAVGSFSPLTIRSFVPKLDYGSDSLDGPLNHSR
jgi:hypothetical protein